MHPKYPNLICFVGVWADLRAGIELKRWVTVTWDVLMEGGLSMEVAAALVEEDSMDNAVIMVRLI